MRTPQEVRRILENTLPNHQRISEAPSRSDLERLADDRGVEVSVVLAEEANKQYKAFNSHKEVVVLMQNPACWERKKHMYSVGCKIINATAIVKPASLEVNDLGVKVKKDSKFDI